MADSSKGQVNVQGLAIRDRGGSILSVDSDEVGIQNIGGILYAVKTDGTTSPLGGTPWGAINTNGSNTQDWTLASGLAGDTDGNYQIDGFIVPDANGTLYELRPNALATPSGLGQTDTIVAGAATPAQRTTILFAQAVNTGIITFRIFFEGKSGRNRAWRIDMECNGGGSWWETHGQWTDTATVLTSFTIHASTSVGVQTGSKCIVTKLGMPAF